MKKSLLKKVSAVLALSLTVGSFCSCTAKKEEPSESEKAISYESWWTDGQKKTLDSLRKCDKDGFLYELDYEADYDIDKLIEAGTNSSVITKTNFRKLFIKGSEFEVPSQIYGGCSAFATKDANGNQIMGRNYDWMTDDEIAVVVNAHPENGYASVGMSDVGFAGIANDGEFTNEDYEKFFYAPIFTTDGINEKGLACTILLLDEDGAKQETGKTTISSSIIVRLLLDKASTVKEAEELLRKYDIVSAFYKDRSVDPNGGKSFHWLVTDKSGDSAVFEIVDGKLTVNRTPLEIKTDFDKFESPLGCDELNKAVEINYPKKDKGYQLVTNFYVSEGYQNNVGEGYWRYKTLENVLSKNSHPTKKEAMNYLEQIKFFKNDVDSKMDYEKSGENSDDSNVWGWITVWSEIYDTENLTMDVCIRENYETTYSFSVK